MSECRTPWFWNTAVLARLAWLLLAAVFAAYASRALTDWGRPGVATTRGAPHTISHSVILVTKLSEKLN
jgi:hypothetical protein